MQDGLFRRSLSGDAILAKLGTNGPKTLPKPQNQCNFMRLMAAVFHGCRPSCEKQFDASWAH